MKCRHCAVELNSAFLDLGFAPPSNAYVTASQLQEPELYFPLRLRVCEACWLVQTEDYARADALFQHDYAYFSSVSQTWLDHAARYAFQITERLALNDQSFVVEVASNDGYLLKNFVRAGIPCLGIEPTADTADAATRLGVPVLREFFGETLGRTLASKHGGADLIVANNVYAHVPDINDFTRGLAAALKSGGTITIEFPHLLRLLEEVQFDTVYHEHFSYLSASVVQLIFQASGLRVFDLEHLPTHGGSLRLFGCHADDPRPTSDSVRRAVQAEMHAGLHSRKTYAQLSVRADRVKDELLLFLLEQKRCEKVVMGYGAAAKGNTLLNYAGVKPDLLPYVFDAAPSKQGKFLPGSHVPILDPSQILLMRPDFLLILPWNLADEVMAQQSGIRAWGGRFVHAIPSLTVTP